MPISYVDAWFKVSKYTKLAESCAWSASKDLTGMPEGSAPCCNLPALYAIKEAVVVVVLSPGLVESE